jgi:hypothetical protein
MIGTAASWENRSTSANWPFAVGPSALAMSTSEPRIRIARMNREMIVTSAS